MFKSQFSIGLCLTFVILILTFPNITAAEIKVYDNNDQYLGILIDMDNQQMLTVFILSINASYRLEKLKLENPNTCGYNDVVIFESDDCSGTPYTYGPFPVVLDLKCPPYDGYYLPDLTNGKPFALKSMLLPDAVGNMGCFPAPTVNPSMLYYEMKEIELPFTTPISLPVRFENVANTSDFFVIPVKKK